VEVEVDADMVEEKLEEEEAEEEEEARKRRRRRRRSSLPTLFAKLFANVRAQCAPLDLNLGPAQLSVHRWTSTARQNARRYAT